jgi:hypothetical protein
MCEAPALELDRTTSIPGEVIELSVYYDADQHPKVSLVGPSVVEIALPKPIRTTNKSVFILSVPEDVGDYVVTAKGGGKQTEALFHVRKPWGWYLRHARAEALRMQIKPMQHREGWLSFFSAYLAHTYFPDAKKLAETEDIFRTFYSLMVDPATGDFYRDKPTWHTRPQNTSWMVGMMVVRYAATGKIEDLEEAAKWGDVFIRKFQKPSGAYEGYTAVTLGAKFLMDLALFERPLAEKDPVWDTRYKRHRLSAKQSAADLLETRDLGSTEGEATYEDSQAGSAWSLLALHALTCDDPAMRTKFFDASVEVQKRHTCLTQALIPDGRMRGGTLRFWESQYDVLVLPNMMNSPHGWTMRSQFGAFYLYLLTGEEQYLNIMNNAMGACVQAIDEKTGVLRWAFVPDPYIEAQEFVPDPDNPGQGKRVPAIIGEQWLPMISDWWRVPEGQIGSLDWKPGGFHGFSQGWSCDNDVHEHFRILAEDFVPNAFVLEREDGSIRTMNCQAECTGHVLTLTLAEKTISRIHFNLKNDFKVIVLFAEENVEQTVERGMHWVGPGGVPELFR